MSLGAAMNVNTRFAQSEVSVLPHPQDLDRHPASVSWSLLVVSAILFFFASGCTLLYPGAAAPQPDSPQIAKKKRMPRDLPGPKAQPSYESLRARINQFDDPADFRELRLAYTRTDAYHPRWVPDDLEKAMLAALDRHDYEKALDLATYRLEENYVDINAHDVLSVAYWELDQPELATFHKFVKYGLIDSILSSGDGKTPQSAYVVIDVAEEAVVLDVLGYEEKERRPSIVKNGILYDELQVSSRKTGETRVVYFNIDIPKKKMSGRF